MVIISRSVVILLIVDILVPLSITVLLYIFKKDKLWLSPIIMFILSLAYLIYKILTYSPGKLFYEQVRLFFHNDSSMIIMLMLVPMLFFSISFTGFFHSIFRSGNKTKL